MKNLEDVELVTRARERWEPSVENWFKIAIGSFVVVVTVVAVVQHYFFR